MKLFNKMEAVAIDGPAGSGKSTISKLVADRLGYFYVDTGAMYRALTLKVMKKNIDLADAEGIIGAASDAEISFDTSGKDPSVVRVILDGEDVSEDIRKMEVTGNVKYIARIPEVREKLVNLQRKMVSGLNGSVMEGRDIGTVVLADARYKFYVDASFSERVERRYNELRLKGHPVMRQEVADDLKQRDHADKTREVGPLKKAEDAIFIDTTDLSIDEVVNKIIEYIK